MKKNFLIESNFVNCRLDRWIRINICKVPQSLIEKNIRRGKIKVNNKKKKSSYKLQEKDLVSVYNLNFYPNLNNKSQDKYVPTKKDLSGSSSMFIENNDNFVVINKPAGISVQSGTKSKRNILDILKNTKEFSDSTPFSVHRIDKETSGILIVAKNRKYAQLFTSLFRIRRIHKTYVGVILGQLEKDKGTFHDILFDYEGNKKIESKAITHYEVIDSNKNYSLIKLNPITGRKHQLRKQLLLHGHPILGDSKYRISKKNFNKKNFLMLHAHKISFAIDKKRYIFTAEAPDNFKKVIMEKYLKIF